MVCARGAGGSRLSVLKAVGGENTDPLARERQMRGSRRALAATVLGIKPRWCLWPETCSLPGEPSLPFVPGHEHLDPLRGPGHADGAAAFPLRLPVLFFYRHPDYYSARLRGDRSRDGA